MSYIDKDFLLDAILEIPCKMDEDGYGWISRSGVYRMISDFPPADVQKTVIGTWEYNPGGNVPYCNQCLMPQDVETDFCHSCGADMRHRIV